MNMARRIWLALVLLAALIAEPLAAQADYPPRPDGPIYDGANMISPATEAALDQRLRDYNRETGRALIIATVPDLGGANIESYATGLFANWGIGGAKRDQGLLLLIARDDRKMRIEVGYGLHPYFGGIMAGRVIRDEITPRFKEGDFDGGIVAGIDAITAHLAKSPEEAAAIEEAARAAAAQEQESSEQGFPIGLLFWLAIIFFFFILPMLGRMRGGRRYRGGGVGGAVGNVVLWTALNAAMNSGRGGGSSWGGGGGGFGGGGGGGFGGFGGGMSGGGGASGSW